jgi:hypothetical protein
MSKLLFVKGFMIRFLIWMITLITFTFSGCKSKLDKSTNITFSDDWLGTTSQPYSGPEIVRLTWGSIPEQYTSNERFLELKDAGFTHHFHYWYSNADEVQKALNAAMAAGVKMIITCPELASEPEPIVRRFMTHPALEGYFIKDEPSYQQSIIEAGILADRIRAVDTNHQCYMNLMLGGKTNTVSGTEYSVYLDWVKKHFSPDIVSFDNYSISKNKETGQIYVRPDWYDNFESIASFSKNLEKPFWAFAMAVEHTTPAKCYVEPLIDHFRLQIYSALAYGAQGIQYFTYWTPTNLNDGKEHYFKASIMPDGTKTNIYDLVKTVNEEIKNLSFVFAGSTVKWVRHKGITSQREVVALENELSLTPVKSVVSNGGILLALHEKGNSQYLVIVNYELSSNKLSLNSDTEVKRVLKSGALVAAEKDVLLKPGDAVIYSWKK